MIVPYQNSARLKYEFAIIVEDCSSPEKLPAPHIDLTAGTNRGGFFCVVFLR